MIRRLLPATGLCAMAILAGCGGGDGGTAPPSPPPVVETWRVAAESSFDITSLAVDPGGDLVAVGGDRVLARRGSDWVDNRPEDAAGLNGVWATNGTAFAVGDAGLVLRRDGHDWSVLPTGVDADLRAVSGRGPADVVVVGEGGTILHHDGAAWADRSVAGQATFLDVWCDPAGGAYAVTSEGDVWRESGGAWARVDLGIAGYVPEELVGITGASAEEVYAYGDHERVLRFDGSSWRIDRDGPTSHVIVGLAFGPADTLLAVTADGRVLSRDGGTWQVATSIGFPTFPAALAAGPGGAVYLAGGEAGVLQMDGDPTTWTVLHRYWRDDIVAAVRDDAGGHVLVADSGLIRRLVDGQWIGVRPDPAAVVTRAWSADGETIATIGSFDRVAILTGGGYTVHVLGLGMTPRGIDGRDDGTLLIVGRDGRIARGGGDAWQEQASGTIRNLWDVCFLGADEALAVGEGGTVLHWDGGSWQAEAGGPEADLLQLALDTDGRVFVLGRIVAGVSEYRVYRRDPEGWSQVGADGSFAGEAVNSLAVGADGNLRVCTAAGGIYLWQDGRWHGTAVHSEFRLQVVAIADEGSALVAGGDGAILVHP